MMIIIIIITLIMKIGTFRQLKALVSAAFC